VQLAILPQITCSSAVGLDKLVSDLHSGFTVMPNPGTGLFHLIFTLKKEQDINLRVYNAVGQELSSAKLTNVMNNVMSLDLSDQPQGIYFAEISAGQEKVVKKIVINH
jgi:hypothetical protein